MLEGNLTAKRLLNIRILLSRRSLLKKAEIILMEEGFENLI